MGDVCLAHISLFLSPKYWGIFYEEMKMNLNEFYSVFIDKVWSGSVRGNSPEAINAEVMEICDKVQAEIVKCSQAMVAVHVMYELFYTATSLASVYKSAKDLLMDPKKLLDWIDVLAGDKYYRTCVLNAARNWRSPLELAFMGL